LRQVGGFPRVTPVFSTNKSYLHDTKCIAEKLVSWR